MCLYLHFIQVKLFILCSVMMEKYKEQKMNNAWCVKYKPRANGTQNICIELMHSDAGII